MGRKLLKTVQTITTFRNPLADPVGTRRRPPLVRGPQFENRCYRPTLRLVLIRCTLCAGFRTVVMGLRHKALLLRHV